MAIGNGKTFIGNAPKAKPKVKLSPKVTKTTKAANSADAKRASNAKSILPKAKAKTQLIQLPPKGSVAYAKYMLEEAINGGAMKKAEKLALPKKVGSEIAYEFYGSDGTRGTSRERKPIYSQPGDAAKIKKEILAKLKKELKIAQAAEAKKMGKR